MPDDMALQPTDVTPASNLADCFVVICQNNEKRSVKIKEMSDELGKALGVVPSEVEGLELKQILGFKVAELVEEYLEYDNDSNDVDDILKRVRDFKLKRYNGEEVSFAHRVTRQLAPDQHQWFRLDLKDERRQIQDASLQVMLKQNMAGLIRVDDETNLADRASCEKCLELIQNYVNTNHLKACFAVLRLDRHEGNMQQYGKIGCEKLLQHVASSCKAKFREEDLVCRLGDHTLGLILMDITKESARVVLNRLRWFVASHRIVFGGKSDFSVTVSITFAELKPNMGENFFIDCMQEADSIPASERNQLVEVDS